MLNLNIPKSRFLLEKLLNLNQPCDICKKNKAKWVDRVDCYIDTDVKKAVKFLGLMIWRDILVCEECSKNTKLRSIGSLSFNDVLKLAEGKRYED